MKVLILTDDPEFDAVMSSVALLTPPPVYAPLNPVAPPDAPTPDVVLVDSRTDLLAARGTCRLLATVLPAAAVVAVVRDTDLVAVDMDWGIDEVVFPAARPGELLTRLRWATCRRRARLTAPAPDIVHLGDLLLDEASYTAFAGDRRLDLTLTEFKLLSYLARNAGRAFTRDHLLREVWGHGSEHPKTVDVYVKRLRAKLGGRYESLVDTVRGVGYMAARPRQPRAAGAGQWRIVGSPGRRDTAIDARRPAPSGLTDTGHVPAGSP